jgi:serpin B
MKQLVEIVCTFAALSIFLSACGPAPSASVAQSSLSRNTAPDVPKDDVAALVQGNNAFALDLYGTLRPGNSNLAFSPYSLSVALAMPYAGARGDTGTQMAQTLHYTLPQDRLHPAFNQLDLDLTKEGEASERAKNPLQLKIANAVWGEKTFSFLPEYLDTIARNYGAGIQLADFVNQNEAVRKQINDWVSRQTNDKIKDLIPQGALDAYTRMVLVNALYFKADWQEPFDPSDTVDAPFNLLDGSQVPSKQMSNHLSGVPYASGDGYQAVELAYQGNTAAMDLIVPDAGNFEKFESSLDAQKLDAILASMQPVNIQLAMPKFTFKSSFDLGDRLASLGVSDAFNADRADFSGMTGKRDLYITKVLHQAYVAVDEKGTEAAAATSVIMGLTAIMIPDKQLIIDHPFIFLIRDTHSGQILFIGRVLNPGK